MDVASSGWRYENADTREAGMYVNACRRSGNRRRTETGPCTPGRARPHAGSSERKLRALPDRDGREHQGAGRVSESVHGHASVPHRYPLAEHGEQRERSGRAENEKVSERRNARALRRSAVQDADPTEGDRQPTSFLARSFSCPSEVAITSTRTGVIPISSEAWATLVRASPVTKKS